MKIKTRFFDEIEIDKKDIVAFPNGLFGFENEKRFLLIYDSDEEVKNIMFLQCIDNENLCFVVIDTRYFGEMYDPVIQEDAYRSLSFNMQEDKNNAIILAIAVIYQEFEKSTANLLSPILINPANNMAMQVILDTSLGRNSLYKTKQLIFEKEFAAETSRTVKENRSAVFSKE